jgi:hypothetical protein
MASNMCVLARFEVIDYYSVRQVRRTAVVLQNTSPKPVGPREPTHLTPSKFCALFLEIVIMNFETLNGEKHVRMTLTAGGAILLNTRVAWKDRGNLVLLMGKECLLHLPRLEEPKNQPVPSYPSFGLLVDAVLKDVSGAGFLAVGERVCRRSIRALHEPVSERRVDNSMLTIEQVATRTRSGQVGYFCRDKHDNLHFLNAYEVRRVAQ